MESALSEQCEYAGQTCARQDLSVGHLVLPRAQYSQDAAETSRVEGVQMPFLPGVCGSCLTTVQQCADNTGIVHCYLGLRCQLGVGPHTCCEARKGCGCLPDSLIKLCVQGEVVSDSGAKECELMYRIELIFVDSDD